MDDFSTDNTSLILEKKYSDNKKIKLFKNSKKSRFNKIIKLFDK